MVWMVGVILDFGVIFFYWIDQVGWLVLIFKIFYVIDIIFWCVLRYLLVLYCMKKYWGGEDYGVGVVEYVVVVFDYVVLVFYVVVVFDGGYY